MQKMNSTAVTDVSLYLPFFVIYVSFVRRVFYCFLSYNLEMGKGSVKVCLPECVLITPEYHISQNLRLMIFCF